MKNNFASAVLAAMLVALAFISSTQAQVKTLQFVNGNWFNGKKFERKVFYSVADVLTVKKPATVDEVVDLANGYVVPPFADAHCHNFDAAFNIDQQIAAYLRDGVFYAKVQTDVRTSARAVASKVNIPTSVDVAYAHGALTSTYGHGVEVYEGLALFYKTGQFSPDEEEKVKASRVNENDAYYIIDNADDLEKKWPRILKGKPDFIKIYLLESENFAQKKRDLVKLPVGSIGLDPDLVPEIVKKAHAANLRVSAHVDTVTDYRIALKAGVDEMAHLPGYYIDTKDELKKYQLTKDDARETAKRSVWVDIAPVAYDFLDPANPGYKADIRSRTDFVRVQNLKLLKQAKAKIAFGSDRYNNTPLADALYIQKRGVFTNREMLNIWCDDTAQSIFPNRKIGKLKEGFEVSFLVLAANPLVNFDAVKNIKLRYKQGISLDN